MALSSAITDPNKKEVKKASIWDFSEEGEKRDRLGFFEDDEKESSTFSGSLNFGSNHNQVEVPSSFEAKEPRTIEIPKVFQAPILEILDNEKVAKAAKVTGETAKEVAKDTFELFKYVVGAEQTLDTGIPKKNEEKGEQTPDGQKKKEEEAYTQQWVINLQKSEKDHEESQIRMEQALKIRHLEEFATIDTETANRKLKLQANLNRRFSAHETIMLRSILKEEKEAPKKAEKDASLQATQNKGKDGIYDIGRKEGNSIVGSQANGGTG